MRRWERFRQLLGQPAYRIRWGFFLILSLAVLLTSFLVTSAIWSDILLEFAVTFGAVGLLQLLWDFLGGEPVELRIAEVREELQNIGSSVGLLPDSLDSSVASRVGEVKEELQNIGSSVGLLPDSLDSSLASRISEVKEEMREIQSSVALLSDLIDSNIGLERIWPDRRRWQWDPKDGLSVWQDRVCQAEEADIVSNTLWINWMKQWFRQRLFNSIARGTRVRILIYDPDSEVLRLRARDEKDVPGEMRSEIKATLFRLAEDRSTLPEEARQNLEVRLTTKTLHPAQIIRVDDRIVVATYLAGKSGTPSPTMQIRGAGSTYYQKYADQIDVLWARAKPVDDEQFDRILRDYGADPTPPTEE